jgi:hypothetical protein
MRKTSKARYRPQEKLTPEQEAFYAGFTPLRVHVPIASIKKGEFAVITQKDHPWEGSVAQFMGEGIRNFARTGKMAGLFKLVRLDALDGTEFYVEEGGARRATDTEVKIARGY